MSRLRSPIRDSRLLQVLVIGNLFVFLCAFAEFALILPVPFGVLLVAGGLPLAALVALIRTRARKRSGEAVSYELPIAVVLTFVMAAFVFPLGGIAGLALDVLKRDARQQVARSVIAEHAQARGTVVKRVRLTGWERLLSSRGEVTYIQDDDVHAVCFELDPFPGQYSGLCYVKESSAEPPLSGLEQQGGLGPESSVEEDGPHWYSVFLD